MDLTVTARQQSTACSVQVVGHKLLQCYIIILIQIIPTGVVAELQTYRISTTKWIQRWSGVGVIVQLASLQCAMFIDGNIQTKLFGSYISLIEFYTKYRDVQSIHSYPLPNFWPRQRMKPGSLVEILWISKYPVISEEYRPAWSISLCELVERLIPSSF